MKTQPLVIEDWDGDGARRMPDEALQELGVDVGDTLYLVEEVVGKPARGFPPKASMPWSANTPKQPGSPSPVSACMVCAPRPQPMPWGTKPTSPRSRPGSVTPISARPNSTIGATPGQRTLRPSRSITDTDRGRRFAPCSRAARCVRCWSFKTFHRETLGNVLGVTPHNATYQRPSTRRVSPLCMGNVSP